MIIDIAITNKEKKFAHTSNQNPRWRQQNVRYIHFLDASKFEVKNKTYSKKDWKVEEKYVRNWEHKKINKNQNTWQI